MIKKQELIHFAKFLDEGCDHFGIGYIQVKVDDYLKLLEKEREARQKQANDLIDAIKKEDLDEYCSIYDIPKGWVNIEDFLPMMLAVDFLTGTTYKVKDKQGAEFLSIIGDHNTWYYYAKENGITHWYNE